MFSESNLKDDWLQTLVKAIDDKCNLVPILVLSTCQYAKDILKAINDHSIYNLKAQSLIG